MLTLFLVLTALAFAGSILAAVRWWDGPLSDACAIVFVMALGGLSAVVTSQHVEQYQQAKAVTEMGSFGSSFEVAALPPPPPMPMQQFNVAVARPATMHPPTGAAAPQAARNPYISLQRQQLVAPNAIDFLPSATEVT